MKIKLSIHLKNGKVISRIESNLDQETLDCWLDGFLEDVKEWILIGELPSLSLIPIGAIECIRFEEITQPLEKVD
ncbi:hypothetical protein NGB81_07160 [Enterococcus faecalis]|uniref:hypothetical protein n=1 Tax=Enterococcus faecalis TaxID=1351 RepID=UPI002DBC3607|nr:hypothetical protein [Enterococcus faecalis]MEB7497369.1 hypothetical protein [Enterococcus faecalis]